MNYCMAYWHMFEALSKRKEKKTNLLSDKTLIAFIDLKMEHVNGSAASCLCSSIRAEHMQSQDHMFDLSCSMLTFLKLYYELLFSSLNG